MLKQYLGEPFVFASATSGAPNVRNRYREPLVIIIVTVSLVLLIACANIANLMLACANARRHELSLRLAMGASQLRIARQLLTESLLLSAAGAALGLLFAQWGAGCSCNSSPLRRKPSCSISRSIGGCSGSPRS
jgi:putative ABC transport system permease protein